MASTFSLRLRRGPGSAGGFLQRAWRQRWIKVLALLGALGLVAVAGLWVAVARDLPSVDTLRAYEPPLPTNVRAGDGLPIHSYARERRVELAYAEYPKMLVNAFLAAEDRTFFQHHGVDYPGIVAAMITNLRNDGRPVGASTITQQVAKNLLVGSEVSYVRKAREAILAYRIEDTLTKPQILELYLNTIFLGRNAYGVAAASDAYFGKELKDLSLSQMAYLAILPKGPSNYDPARRTERALGRRNWVLGEMRENGFITDAAYREAAAQPLGTITGRRAAFRSVGGYFVEEVRRQLIGKFGESAKDGPFSVYSGGLWVRTSFDGRLQDYAQEALRDGLLRFDRGRGWSGPLGHAAIADGWRGPLAASNIAIDYKDWRAAIVTGVDAAAAQLGFTDGRTGDLPRWAAQMPVRGQGGTAFAALKVGDIVAVAPEGGQWGLRSVPRISGGMVVEEPATGRVLAMQGGFDNRIQAFNRATQAQRQPGSTIKPIVYSAGLERGMTPASIVVDGAFCVYQGAALGQKCFRNFANQRAAGPHTMRWGIEQSRNLMTVRAANSIGMNHVTGFMKRVGVGDYPPYLSFALGAGETTVLKMVNAYSILANNGKNVGPTLVDFVQDRRGKVVWPENWRACDGCNMARWDGKPMPRPPVRGRQVMDAMSAYQMVHIAEGVIQRGTATTLRDLKRPIFGKTGTTNGPTDVWFIGGTPQYVAGVYLGHDRPVNLGGYAQGGTVAAPIFKQFAVKAYEGLEVLPFRGPPGIRMVRIDRASGQPVYGAWPTDDPKSGVIWEAFKPQQEARRAARRTSPATPTARPTARATTAPPREDFLQREGGIY